MIESFGDKRTAEIFAGRKVKRIESGLQKKILRRLRYINAAQKIDDLKIPPSNRLEKKAGDLKEFYAIWVNSQWRIIFKWSNGSAQNVQLIDYH
ncbi:type II toxin-antitoxin system RelE/ParE family toxin [Robiginitomaculum antarcticum]|uniref:type II toxin-antitoxin system RelE/ParE family toxin n=1 Tax=Robiginitomaculum antarcticum TaxID=437507 RepID=UPI00036B5CAE|nr:type II toxin-antitoxin system RelE/ParE family toxin [Robiginitomaculum antarcticum]